MNDKKLLVVLLLAGILLAACSEVPPPTLSPRDHDGQAELVEPMLINEVEIIGTDPEEPRPGVVVSGVIGDSCNSLDSVNQSRDGFNINVQINIRRVAGGACAELAQLYDETIPLEGEFPAGEYTLVINGTTVTFSIVGGTVGTPSTPQPQPTVSDEPTPALAGPTCIPDAQLVEDDSPTDEVEMVAGASFTHTWRIRNNGTCPWNDSYSMVQVEGDTLQSDGAAVPLPAAQPDDEVELSVDLTLSPEAAPGSQHAARFQMRSPIGVLFGVQPFVQVTVMSSTGEDDGEADSVVLACTPESEFVADVTIPDGTQIPAGVPFTKIWRIRNTGTCTWDETFELVQIRGELILPTAGRDPVPMPITAPDETLDISLELIVSPDAPVDEQQTARFQIRGPDGELFGTQPFVVVEVVENP